MKLIRLLSVFALSFGLAACDNSDSKVATPAAVESAPVETSEIADQETPEIVPDASVFLGGAQRAIEGAQKAAEELEEAAQETADQVSNLSEDEDH